MLCKDVDDDHIKIVTTLYWSKSRSQATSHDDFIETLTLTEQHANNMFVKSIDYKLYKLAISFHNTAPSSLTFCSSDQPLAIPFQI